MRCACERKGTLSLWLMWLEDNTQDNTIKYCANVVCEDIAHSSDAEKMQSCKVQLIINSFVKMKKRLLRGLA